MNGHLRERPLAELIREINAAKLSGALRLARERVRAVVYAEAGEIISARSNLRVHRLVVCLHRWGVLAEDQLSAHVTELMSDTEAGAALVAAGAITKDTLYTLYARQTADVLRPLLLWTEGEWSFDPRARLGEDVRCKLEARQLLLEAARQLPAEYVATRLADEAETISPVAAPHAQIQLQPLEGFVLSRVEAPLALGELLAISGIPEAQARQSIYALALGGLVARSGWTVTLSGVASAQSGAANTTTANAAPDASVAQKTAAEDAATKQDAPPDPRIEIDALFARVQDADNYRILGLERSAAASEIKRAYYALAKRFHPDRFQRDADASLRTQIEAAFMKITQAYETLSDARTRAAYDLKLSAQIGAPGTSSQSSAHAASTAKVPADAHLSREQRAAERFTQGVAALRQNNLSSAVTLLGEAARLAPQHPRYHAYYGSALARDVRTRHQAEAALQTAIKLDGNDPAYHVMLAELLRTLGQLLRAERALERALELDPNHDAARRQLDQLRRMKKK